MEKKEEKQEETELDVNKKPVGGKELVEEEQGKGVMEKEVQKDKGEELKEEKIIGIGGKQVEVEEAPPNANTEAKEETKDEVKDKHLVNKTGEVKDITGSEPEENVQTKITRKDNTKQDPSAEVSKSNKSKKGTDKKEKKDEANGEIALRPDAEKVIKIESSVNDSPGDSLGGAHNDAKDDLNPDKPLDAESDKLEAVHSSVGAKNAVEADSQKNISDDSDFDEENFSDDALLEEDLHLTDASDEEKEIKVTNPEVLNHFGDKLEVELDDEVKAIPLQTDTKVLREVTFADTVDEIVTKLKTTAVIKESISTKPEQSRTDFAAFNWKPNVKFFNFSSDEATTKTDASAKGGGVFRFEPGAPLPPSPVKRRGASVPRGATIGAGWGAGGRPRRVATSRERGRRRDRSV